MLIRDNLKLNVMKNCKIRVTHKPKKNAKEIV